MESQSEDLRDENGFLSFLQTAGELLSSLPDQRDLLARLTRLIRRTMRVEGCALVLHDPVRHQLVVETTHGQEDRPLHQHRLPDDVGVAGWVISRGEPALVADPSHDPRFDPEVDEIVAGTGCSLLAVPMLHQGRAIGAVEVANRISGDPLGDQDLRLLTSLARLAAAAMESSRGYETLKWERDEILKAGEETRRRLARDLRIGPLQKLAAAERSMGLAERLAVAEPDRARTELQKLRVMVQSTADELRSYLFDLSPLVLETHGLVPALLCLLQELGEEGLHPEMTVEGSLPRLPAEREHAAFSILREALLNALEHAHPSHLQVRLEAQEGNLVATVRDNGVGFDPDDLLEKRDRRASFGLFQMRARAVHLGGQLAIESEEAQGTTVTLRLPLG